MKKKYLLYVNEYSLIANDYVVKVYECETQDIFHTMGEMMYRKIEQIKRIDFVEDNEQRRNYLKERGATISKWQDKYSI